MCATDEVALVDAVDGADLNARATACAKAIVDGSEVILNGDRTVGTGLLALHTADTAVLAVLTSVCALIVVGALNDNALGVVDKVDNAVRTLSYADATADTLLRVDFSYLVLDGDSVLRTYLSAVAVTKTCERTELVAAVRHISGAAALESAELISSLYCLTSTVTGNVSNLFNYILSLNAENGCDALSSGVTAGHAEVGRGGSALGESLSVAVTARVAASATVSAGKAVTDSHSSFVLFHSEEYACEGEKCRTCDRDSNKNKNRNKNSHIFSPFLRKQFFHNARKAEECKRNDGSRNECDGNALERLGAGTVLNS